MNDDIIRMAQEAQQERLSLDGRSPSIALSGYWFSMEVADLARFADIVRAAEREACAKVCDKKAKETFSGQCQVWGDYFARAIRARSKK